MYCGCRFGGAGGAVARASGLRCAIFESRHLFAGLLNGAFDTQFAHVFVGGNFGVDVVSLEIRVSDMARTKSPTARIAKRIMINQVGMVTEI